MKRLLIPILLLSAAQTAVAAGLLVDDLSKGLPPLEALTRGLW